jgi:hypothetical protein
MTFRIIEGQQDDKANPGSAYYRGLLANRYPNVKVLEEFHEEAGGMSGVAFDFHWLSQGNTVRASRAVFIPSRGGVLEFSLICSPDRFQQVRYDFNFLLLTFRASKDGKLEVTPRSSLF